MDSFLSFNGTEFYFVENYSALSQKVGEFGSNVLWIVDEVTAKMVRPLPEPNVVLPSGERGKNWESISTIIKEAYRNRLGRDTRFIAFGGGVISDLSSFAASIYMRGCNITLIPTTLLSMVDATLGGKTGIDFCNIKNLLGTFYPAQEVLICPETLSSLSSKEYRNGLAEVIKHSLLTKDESLYLMLLQNKKQILERDKETMKKLIELSLLIKKEFLINDPHDDKGIRIALNLGHTFGHALESHSRMSSWSHGEAVAWGICRALDAGMQLGVTDKAFALEAMKLFKFYDFDTSFRLNRGEWLDYKDQMLSDKKKADGYIRFVLLHDQGDPFISNLDFNMVRDLVIKQPLG